MRSIVVALALVGVVGCGKPASDGKQVASQSKVMTREEFEAKIKGLISAQEFINQLGTPTKTEQRGQEFILYYAKFTRDTITGKIDNRVFIVFNGDGVNATYDRHSIVS
jgi:hypothetical protein